MSHSDTYLMALLLALPCPASGGEADVVSARAIRAANGSFHFEVTIRSQDRGWDHYADRFEILAPDGTVLGVRQLAHPHVDEQPSEPPGLPAARAKEEVRQPQDTALRLGTVRPPVH